MYVQVEKPKENKSRAVANSVAQKKSNVKQGFGFLDNRPEVIAHRKIEGLAYDYSVSQPIQKKESESELAGQHGKDVGVAVAPESESPLQSLTNKQFNSNLIFLADVAEMTSRDPSQESSLDLVTHSRSTGRGVAYIVNAIVSYEELGELRNVITSMTDGLEKRDEGRIAIVIGVNARVEDTERMMEDIQGAQEAIESYPFAIALVPLSFDGDKFPYGLMRNQVLHSEATRSMTRYFTHLGLHPYISIQDFDTGSRRVGDDEGRHIFHAIDNLMAPLVEEEMTAMEVEEQEKTKEFFGHEDSGFLEEEEGGMHYLPLMIAGGYRVGNIDKLHERTKARLIKQEIELSDDELTPHLEKFVPEIESDMKYRQQYARLDPMLPYAPEPNLFLDATAVMSGSPHGHQLAFGRGAAEFTELGKNVSRFAADELETHFKQRYHIATEELRRQEIPVGSPQHKTILEELKTELMIHSQNNRHPIRDTNVVADYAGLNVETDLSRLATTAYTNSRTAQSHFGLTTVVDRFYDSKGDKKGAGASKVKDYFSKQLNSLDSIQNIHTLDEKRISQFGVGKKMSEALSVPYGHGLFSGMNYGVQKGQKEAVLYQIGIEQSLRGFMDNQTANRGFMDNQTANHAAMIQNFKQNPYPLHGSSSSMRVTQWTVADGHCGVYALRDLLGKPEWTREQLAEELRKLGTPEANAAADGISGVNMNLWLSYQQVAKIGQLLGLNDIAIVTFNLQTNTWGTLYGQPGTSNNIIGGVPSSVDGPVNHWVVLQRD